MALDRYPHLVGYITGLPKGLASYPECRVKTEVHAPAVRESPQLVELKGLPSELERFVRGQHQGKWMPEVVAGAFGMLVRDVIYDNDDDLLAWRRRQMVELFRKPTYRIMMFLLSPTLIIMNATKRWATFHTGSTLHPATVKSDGNKRTVHATLEFPAGVFNELFARLVGTTYQAALDCCQAPNARVDIESITPTQVEFVASWDER